MPRKPSPTLTEAEQRLMEMVWQLGEATVADVTEALPKSEPLAYNTVLTTLRILEGKGYLKHKKVGRAFVYSAKVGRDLARRRALSELVRRFFDGSNEKLALNLFEQGDLDTEVLKDLRREVEEET